MGDAIAERTGLGRIWIGLILLAIITSIPEVVTSISSVTILNLPDLSVGNIMGSCMFNLTLFALADLIYRPEPFLKQLSPGHGLSVWFGIILSGIVALGIIYPGELYAFTFGRVSLPSIFIISVYVLGIYLIFRYNSRSQPRIEAIGHQTGHKVYLKFGLAATVIVASAVWLSFIGDEITNAYGLHSGFVGTLFVAVTTSLPELAVTISAVRLGAMDMVAANVLGSNLFDIAIISLADFAYTRDSIFHSVSGVHLVSVICMVAMNLVIITGLRFRPKRKAFYIMSWHSVALIGIYIFAITGNYMNLLKWIN